MGAGDFLFGGGGSQSSSPRNPGTGIGGGILADIFGAPTRLSHGKILLSKPGRSVNQARQFLQQTDPRFAPSSVSLRDNIATGGNPRAGRIGLGDPRRAELDAAARGLVDSGFRSGDDTTGLFANFGDPATGDDRGFLAIRDLLTQENPFQGDFLGLARDAASRQGDIFSQSADSLSGLIADGSPVDVSALTRSGITDLKEQFSGLGGLFGSDLQSESLRLGTELGVSAEEAARQRQLQAIGLGQTLGANQLGFSTDLLSAGGLFERLATPGGRALALFQNLFGPQSSNLFSEGASSKGTSGSPGILGGIGLGVNVG